jgi:3-hydroxyisobutyrate dehydrogenase-like beta-hydroxyacid dehydrogenase
MTPESAPAGRSRIGWIGLGRIGAPMAERVRAAGWPLMLWARQPGSAAAAALVERGATRASTATELAQRCDIVCTIVTGPQDVSALQADLMPEARPGTLFIDLSTATPGTALAAARLAQAHGQQWLDAPVTGGVAGAVRGTLTCFVGGEAAVLERARSLLSCFAQRLVHGGGPGSGYRTKLINQTLVAGVLMGLADGARLARAAGIAAGELLPALGSGTAGSFLLESYLPRMMGGEGPVTFTLALLLKDLHLARGEAQALGVAAPLLDAAIAAVAAAQQRHGPEAGVQALAL